MIVSTHPPCWAFGSRQPPKVSPPRPGSSMTRNCDRGMSFPELVPRQRYAEDAEPLARLAVNRRATDRGLVQRLVLEQRDAGPNELAVVTGASVPLRSRVPEQTLHLHINSHRSPARRTTRCATARRLAQYFGSPVARPAFKSGNGARSPRLGCARSIWSTSQVCPPRSEPTPQSPDFRRDTCDRRMRSAMRAAQLPLRYCDVATLSACKVER